MTKASFIGHHFIGDGCATHDIGTVVSKYTGLDPVPVVPPIGVPAKRLATSEDICTFLGMSISNVSRLSERKESTGFPDHVSKRGNGYLWDMREVEAWFDYWRLTRRTKYE